MDSGGAFGRGESRHPEWDLMYRKGMTVGRIATVCNVVPQTVSRHIRVQRAQYPDMEVEHLAHRPSKRHRTTGRSWQPKIDALMAFWDGHQRYPTSGDPDPANRMLANWLSIRRRAARAGDLNEEERQLLAVLPGWEENPRSRSDAERWNRRLEELRVFRASEERWPQFRRPVPESERVLGVWLHAQRQTFGAGQLQTEALSQLDSTVPGWNAWRVKKLNGGSGDAGVMPVP